MEASRSARVERTRTPTTRSPRDPLIAALPVTERRLSLNGVATAVLEGGDGPPIVLLHGPGAYGAQWIDVIPGLVSNFRVIAPDLPGHGATEFFDGMPTPDEVSAWLDDLIECCCPTRPVLLGMTLGGAIAARYAADHGKRVAAIVLVDSFGLAPFQPLPEFGAALQAYLADPSAHSHDGLWSQCALDAEAVKRRVGERWQLIREYDLAGIRKPGGRAALMAWIEHFGAPEIPASILQRIDVPTTLIWGREDRATPLAVAERAHASYGWPLHVIDGAADDPTIEQPEMFLKILRRVLEAK